jgi:DNA ligase-1
MLALDQVASTFSHMTDREIKWYTRILQKDLNVGIQKKSINAVFPNLIPTFDVMLAKPLEKYPKKFIMQPKLDGMRIFGNTTTGELFSRNGKQVLGFENVEEDIKKLPRGNWVDGEIISGDKFNSTMTQAFRHSSGKQGILHVFDFVSQDEVEAGEGDYDQIQRDIELAMQFRDIKFDSLVKVRSSDIIDINNPMWDKYANEFYEGCLAEGYEGAMVKDVDAVYVTKRSKSWQKLKPTDTFDLKVIGVEPGKSGTKYEEAVGKLVCKFGDNEVRVRSGLSDEQRNAWWINPTAIVGKVIEIEAQEVTDNQHGTHSLRFPRFKKIRIDK